MSKNAYYLWMDVTTRNGGLNRPKYLNLITNPEAKSYAFAQAIHEQPTIHLFTLEKYIFLYTEK